MNLTNNEIKEFAIKLAKCESEDEVVELLAEYGFWDDETCWTNFGGVENNYSSIGNQQASADSALVEKVINSVDAVIMGDLLSKGINPKSDKAPQSITQYLKEYQKIPEGKLSLLDSSTRQKLSENILLVSTKNSTTKNPNYAIIDSGEGQTANSLPNTILSLKESNKMRVGAVQGKFNMGGTGVLMFSGTRKFQIIISRKRQDIPKGLRGDDDSFHKWCVTIVRRERPTGNMKSSCFKYLAPRGKVLAFEADSLPLKPQYDTNKATPYVCEMYDGTFIKVFDYHIRGYNSVSTIHLHDRLSLLIPGIPLPIKIVECRKTQAKRNKTLYGLNARLEENKQSTLELEPIGINGYIQGEPIQAMIYVFKKGFGESYKKREGVLYTLNGQCQGFETKTFFEKLKLGYIADSILVVVDCSCLSQLTVEELFLNSRDRLKAGPIRDAVIKFIENEIKGISKLKELNTKRRDEELKSKIQDSQLVNGVIENVLTKSKVLNSLLLQGKDIQLPKNTRIDGETIEELGSPKQFPTYFKLKKKNRKTAELERKIRIDLDTDAPNDYFTRDKLSGSYKLEIDGGVLTDYSMKIINYDGILNVFIDPVLFKEGEQHTFKLSIDDETRILPFEIEFDLTIVGKTQDKPSSNNGDANLKGKKEKGLPSICEVRREDWDGSINENTAIKVIPNEDGYDFICNLDNKYLDTERKAPKSNPVYLEGVFSTSLIVATMSVISHYEKINDRIENEEEKINIPQMVEHFSQSLAPTIIPIVSELSKVSVFEINKE